MVFDANRARICVNRKLLDSLLELHAGKKSGVLRLQKDSAKKQLVLHHGLAAFAESNAPQEHLARVMIAAGLLPRTRLNEVAAAMKAGQTSDEAILSLSGVEGGDVEKGRREQAILIMSSLLAWEDCDLRFYPGEDLIRHQLKLGLPVPELVAIAVRRAVSRNLIPIPPEFAQASIFLVPEGSAGNATVFPLNNAELTACALLKKRLSVEKALSLIPPGEMKPLEVLFCLDLLGLAIREIPRAESAPAAPASTEPNPAATKLEELLQRFKSASLYQVLSVPSDASQEAIQNAYHEQARELHPDRFPSSQFPAEIRGMAGEVFAQINQAYLTLRNPVSRAEYDEKLSTKKGKSPTPKRDDAESKETAEALYREGRALLARGDYETAVERLKGAVWLQPQKGTYHHFLGIAESAIPKLRKSAEQHLLKAIELEDLSADSHLALAKLYAQVMLPRKAEQQLHQALLWEPHNPEALKLAAQLKKRR